MPSNDSIHVLMLVENNAYPQDGRVRKEARALRNAGYRVSVIAPQDPAQPRTECVDGVDVYRFPAPASGRGVLGYIWEYGYSVSATFALMLRVYRKSRFDVIHAANPPDLLVFPSIPFLAVNVKFVFDHHDLSPEMFRAKFPKRFTLPVVRALELCEKVSCRLASLVIATNESYREIQIARNQVDPNKAVVVRNAPDLNVLQRQEADSGLRAPAKLILCYVGEIGQHDGVDYLIRALGSLRDKVGRRDFFCWIVGGGDALEECQSLAKELKLDERVCFVGRVPHAAVTRYLSSADICLAPEPSNGYNDVSTMIKIGEYMAIGVPIVAFDLSEHRRWAGEAAAFAAVNDVDAFARTIAELAEDPEARRRMSFAGQERVRTRYSWPAQEEILVGAYARMLGE